jgi:uncharacterized membrane protein
MSLRLSELKDFLREYLGRILIGVGLIFVVAGIMLLSTFYFSVPAFAAVPVVILFLGLVFVAYGFFVQVGMFSVRWRSMNGLGTILLCVSVGFFALAIVAIQIQLVTGFEQVGMPTHGGSIPFVMLFPISFRPFLFLFGLGLELGAAFLVASLVLKAISFLRGY